MTGCFVDDSHPSALLLNNDSIELSSLFQALAASEYHHARNFYAVLDCPLPFRDTAETFVPGEEFEYEYLYKMLAAYGAGHEGPLAEQAYEGAAAAEKVHAALLRQASDVEAYTGTVLYVCPICGYVMTEEAAPERCPVCGGPKKQFQVFEP